MSSHGSFTMYCITYNLYNGRQLEPQSNKIPKCAVHTIKSEIILLIIAMTRERRKKWKKIMKRKSNI